MWCMGSVTAVGITCQQPWKTSGRTGMWLPFTSAHLKYIWAFEHICEPWRTTLRAKRSLTTMPQLSLIIHNWQQLLLHSLLLPKPSLKNCFKLTGVSRGAGGAVRSSDFFPPYILTCLDRLSQEKMLLQPCWTSDYCPSWILYLPVMCK